MPNGLSSDHDDLFFNCNGLHDYAVQTSNDTNATPVGLALMDSMLGQTVASSVTGHSGPLRKHVTLNTADNVPVSSAVTRIVDDEDSKFFPSSESFDTRAIGSDEDFLWLVALERRGAYCQQCKLLSHDFSV